MQIARQIWEQDLGARSAAALIEHSYNALARAVYPSLRGYQAAVDAALYGLRHPQEVLFVPEAVPIFEHGLRMGSEASRTRRTARPTLHLAALC